MDLYFVSCTRGAKEPTLLHCTLVKHGITSFRFFEHNTRGLPACYNEVWPSVPAGTRLSSLPTMTS
jgi:hypothetical protein